MSFHPALLLRGLQIRLNTYSKAKAHIKDALVRSREGVLGP